MSKLTDKIVYSTIGIAIITFILVLIKIISTEVGTVILYSLTLIIILCIIFRGEKDDVEVLEGEE